MRGTWLFLLAVGLAMVLAGPANAQPKPTAEPTGDGVVRAVVFYSENCPHCGDVLYHYLPPMEERYGDQLRVARFNTVDPLAKILYQMGKELFVGEGERTGVPWLVIDNRTLLGSITIRDELPPLIDQYLAQGGIGWPAIPGVAEAMGASEPPTAAPPTATELPTEAATATPMPTATATPTPEPTPTPTPEPSLAERVTGSTAGRALGLLGLVVVLAIVMVVVRAARPGGER